MTHWLRGHVVAVSVVIVFSLANLGEAQTIAAPRCGTGVHEAEATGTVGFPQDQIFCALAADPKEPRSFVSFVRGKFRTLDDPTGRNTNIAAVGLGDNFGLVRWGASRPGDGVQLDVIGSIFAQFDVGSPSNDLINADYIVGFPLTIRRRGFSARVRLYHQSSHLGDEFLLRDEEFQRENLSFESVELILSQEVGPLRAYIGTERAVPARARRSGSTADARWLRTAFGPRGRLANGCRCRPQDDRAARLVTCDERQGRARDRARRSGRPSGATHRADVRGISRAVAVRAVLSR
jgi:hypothetical protein